LKTAAEGKNRESGVVVVVVVVVGCIGKKSLSRRGGLL
jgi:hypothetical protein